MPGQGYGLAIASILFGDRNPAARLPVTFPARRVTRNQILISRFPCDELIIHAGQDGPYV
jgi:hypothetical protein